MYRTNEKVRSLGETVQPMTVTVQVDETVATLNQNRKSIDVLEKTVNQCAKQTSPVRRSVSFAVVNNVLPTPRARGHYTLHETIQFETPTQQCVINEPLPKPIAPKTVPERRQQTSTRSKQPRLSLPAEHDDLNACHEYTMIAPPLWRIKHRGDSDPASTEQEGKSYEHKQCEYYGAIDGVKNIHCDCFLCLSMLWPTIAMRRGSSSQRCAGIPGLNKLSKPGDARQYSMLTERYKDVSPDDLERYLYGRN